MMVLAPALYSSEPTSTSDLRASGGTASPASIDRFESAMASPNGKENPMKSIAMAEAPQNLPQDLITDILLRLPVKSIGQFKCVSKPWRSLLSSPSFVKAHLKLHIHDPEDLIFTSPISDQALYILALTAQSRIYDGIARKVNFPIKNKKAWIEVVASGNGLVLHLLRTRFECRVVLMNPITLEAVELPHRPYVPDTMYCAYGMGFDSSKDDYTIVSISNGRVVDTYSLKMKTWRRLADFQHRLANLLPAAFVNGRIHYLALSDSRTINSGWLLAAFNLASEEFEEVPLPSDVELDGKSKAEIRALDGCLVLVCKSDSCIDVWMMRDYGVQDSWNKFATIQIGPYEIPFFEVICLLNEDQIVLGKNGCKFITYDRRNGFVRDMVIADYRYGFREALTFRESLLSPKLSME